MVPSLQHQHHINHRSKAFQQIQSSEHGFHAQALLYSIELFLLFTATNFTRYLLSRFNRRAQSFSPRQERNIFSGPVVLLLKVYTGFAAANAFYVIQPASMSNVLAHRFNMWLPMCFGYAFELVHRSLSPGLICHHAGAQIATYLWWSSTLFRPQSVMFAFSEMFLAILIFGVGIHGGAAEVIDLIRHLAPKDSMVARWIARCLSKSVWLSFAWQWLTIIRLVLAHRECLTGKLTNAEQVGWSLCFLVFFWTQIGSIQSMNAITRRPWHCNQQNVDYYQCALQTCSVKTTGPILNHAASVKAYKASHAVMRCAEGRRSAR